MQQQHNYDEKNKNKKLCHEVSLEQLLLGDMDKDIVQVKKHRNIIFKR